MKEEGFKIFFKTARVCFVALVCVPLAALILSALIRIDWSSVKTICVYAGAGIVIFSGIGWIIKIVSSD